MSQSGDGGGGEEGASGTAEGTHSFAGEGRSSSLMDLIHQRQGTNGSTQILDLSHAELEVFPTEIEFLRDVLEKLTMSHNSIKTLPLQLNMFTSLRYLNIRANSIKTFPAVLCHLASLEILDMSRNKISRFPEDFGSLMNLRVLSISRNRIDTIPLYVGDMPRLQFLKIEMNPIVFPPPQIVEYTGKDMPAWLNRLKTYLVFYQNREAHPRELMREGNSAAVQETSTMPLPPPQARAARSASESMTTATTHRPSRSESGLRLSIPSGADRPVHHPAVPSPEPSSQIRRSNSQGDDHYRALSHSRGVSGDSNSSFGSNTSNDCEKNSELYFQRLAAYPSLSQPLPSERVKLVEAARGILFALSQIYRAVKQVVGCSTDEKFSLPFVRLLHSANSAVTQLIQALDKFDSSAQVQVPGQPLCAEIVRCCELNVGAFRKLVHMVQMQIRNISMVADARLVRNLVLMLHGALSEIRVAWESLLPLIQTSGDANQEAIESGQSVQKDQQQQQHGSSINLASENQQPHPFQLSPTMPSSSTWLPAQIPHRSQNMSRTSNHSSQSTNIHHDEEEDVQLLVTVERAIESARRLIQSLTETCVTRVESFSMVDNSPQQKSLHRSRSVSASPPRSSGSSESSSAQINDTVNDKAIAQDQAPGGILTTSPLQSTEDTTVAGNISSSNSIEPYSNSNNGNSGGVGSKLENGMVRSPLFSPASDTVPYSSGMCVSLPIVLPSTVTTSATDATHRALAAGGMTENGRDGGSGTSKQERRPVSHTKGSSKTSFDPALPSIPQDLERETSSQTVGSRAPESTSSSSVSASQYQPIMTARSVSVSGLPSTTNQHGPASTSSSNFNSVSYAASSLPPQGLVGPNSGHQHSIQHSIQQPMTPGLHSATLSSYPFPANGGAAPMTAQLWHELRDCLLQMTEIVKRLDLDLTMIRTDDHPTHFHPHQQNQQQQHLYQQHQQHHHTQFAPHHNGYQQNHIPHPHQMQQSSSTHGAVNSGFGPDESNILRRRFGLGVSDFVKSVVVISTLVRQLSSSSNRSNGSGSGSGSAIMASSTTTTVTSTSSVAVLSTSPSAMRTGSVSNSGPDVAATSMTHGNSDMFQDQKRTITPGSISASSSASGSALTASPEKIVQSQQSQHPSQQHGHPHQHYQHHSRHTQPQQQQQQHPEVFSRLVMTNVSNLTKVTRELTVRMPRSSFREYLLSTSSSQPSFNFVAGSSAGGGTGHGPGSFGYGPVGASILAMRKGSLI
ncbi:RAM signaling network component [Mortierella antarctica]|nr:RAM signaling network component [Mortierella antarctica]